VHVTVFLTIFSCDRGTWTSLALSFVALLRITVMKKNTIYFTLTMLQALCQAKCFILLLFNP
jgi:hypothetical protein